MILADTSVWIDYFNGNINAHTDALDAALFEGTAAIADVIFLEILQGFRSDRDYLMARDRLSTLDQYSVFNSGMVEQCAENYRYLRKRGITIRKTNDVIIATYCIEHRLPLLYLDRDFDPFVKHLCLVSVCPKT
ncbi:PIN domain nuclease [Methylicorpusculum sp.]|uniref:type II toxin-antitoxin system VapC family toxin n=1 Tax=Methylicorpusculum sp. TaxID=2713644 RepID=UPI00272F75FC|nr:PIN domain nuclease [Methylicorpusculum sp.]MDP2180210.1 PIN domain nuclease [Methylicorpusculum sp.]MDP3528218.1 PIN domain nuclease [Methylicorpusculum sp.]MDZ4154113.1 PIN domain nuclease [Methylicorpusculum sp.]